MKTAGIYTRLSKDRPQETSRERQEADCRSLCAARGLEVVNVWTDLLSGYRRSVRRPGYEAALASVAAGEIDALVIWKLDRLTRQGVREVGRLLEALEAGGCKLLSVQDSLDTSTAMGEGMLALLASVAKAESENTSVRVKSALAARAARGEMHGPTPYGFARDWSLVPEEAAALAGAAGRVLRGESLNAVLASWHPPGRARNWTAWGLRRTLRSPRMSAIVGPERSAALAALLESGTRAPVRTYLLTRLAECGRCGIPLTPRSDGGGKRRYVCVKVPGRKTCGRLTVKAEPLEALVAGATRAWIAGLDLVERRGGEAEAEELVVVRQRLAAVEEAFFVDGSLSRERFRQLKGSLVDRVDRIEAALVEMSISGVVDVEGAWEVWSLEQRRALVSVYFPRIVVEPLPVRHGPSRFAPRRVLLVDRDGTGWKWECGPDGEELRPVVPPGQPADPRFLRL